MHIFAIKIDLTNFFTDERKYVILQANSDWSDIAGLQKRVETIFELSNIGFLTKDNYYVPAQEPIDILQTLGFLKAFVVTWVGKSSTPMQPLREQTINMRKRKLSLKHNFVSSTPQVDSKRSKLLETNKSPEISSTNELNKICTAGTNTTITSKLSCVTENESKKKPKSNTPRLQQTVTEDTSNVSRASTKTQDTHRNTETRSLQNTHMRFSEDEEAKDASTADCNFTNETSKGSRPNASNTEKIIFRCALMQLPPDKSRSISLHSMPCPPVKILDNVGLPALPKVGTQQDLVEATNAENSAQMEVSVCATETSMAEQTSDNNTNTLISPALCNENSIILLEDSKAEDATNTQEISLAPQDEISELNTSTQADITLNSESNTIKQMMAKSEPLLVLPDLNKVLLFKLTLPSKKTGTPKFTDYIVGSCEYVNRRSKVITVSLISYPPEAEVVLKKITTDMDDSRTAIEKISIKFSELIEPVVLIK